MQQLGTSDDPPPPFTAEPAPSTSTVLPASPHDPPQPLTPTPSTAALPPAYTPAPSAGPLAAVPQAALITHLSLLTHFASLRTRVLASSRGALVQLVPAARWRAFLRLAAYQLEVWLSRVCPRDGSDGPGSRWERAVAALPVEAGFVWWAWMAGGGRAYEEDVRRVWERELKRKEPGGRGAAWLMRDFPVVDLVDRLEGRLLQLVAQRGRQLWEEKTGDAAWDLLEMLEDGESQMWVECPWCGGGCELRFCDASFSAPCPVTACSKPITRETLGLSRLLEDCLAPCTAPREWVPSREKRRSDWARRRGEEEDKVARKVIAGTLSLSTSILLPSRTFSSRELVSAALATQDIQRVLRPLAGPEGHLTDRTATLDAIERVLLESSGLPQRLIRHVLGAYTTPHPFASDLGLSAVQLSALVDALERAGWLAPGFAHGDVGREVLEKAGVRYDLFLTLAGKIARDGPVVVPIDVDFVWITHALQASQYRSDVVHQSGVLLDRTSAIEESLAAAQFDRLAKLWEETAHIPLSFTHAAPTSRNPLKRLLHPTHSPRATQPLSTHPLPASTAPSTGNVVLVHVEKQTQRRRKRREGESGAFLRSAAAEGADGAGVWVVSEREAQRAGSVVVGVDGLLPATSLLGFSHPRTYSPFNECALDDLERVAASEREAARARQARDVVRMFPGR